MSDTPKLRPLDLSNLLKHAFIAGRISAGASSSFHGNAWTDYDPTESAAYARILSAIDVQPDPCVEVIARLVETAENLRARHDYLMRGRTWTMTHMQLAASFDDALAAAKAVLK